MDIIKKKIFLESAKDRSYLDYLPKIDDTIYVEDIVFDDEQYKKIIPLVKNINGESILRYKNMMAKYYWLINEFIPSCTYYKLCRRNDSLMWIEQKTENTNGKFEIIFWADDKLIKVLYPNYNAKISAPTAPIIIGKDFKYWYKKGATKLEPFNFENYTVEENIEFKAYYEVQVFNVSFTYFNQNGVEETTECKVTYNDSVDENTLEKIKKQMGNPVGKTFTDWDGSYSNVTEDRELTALYKTNTFTVRFICNSSKLKEVIVEYNKTVSKPESYEMDIYGYTFVNWYTENNYINAFNFSTKITKDYELYGKYTSNKYTVEFYAYSNNVWAKTATLSVDYNTTINITDIKIPYRENYTSYWTIGGISLKEKKETPAITGDTIITAAYITATKTVTFLYGSISTEAKEGYTEYTNNGKTVYYERKEEISVQYCGTISKNDMPNGNVVSHYSFVKWLNGNEEFTSKTKVTDSMTVVAKYDIEQCTINFYDEYSKQLTGTIDKINYDTRRINYGEVVGELPDYTPKLPDAYSFNGWIDPSDGSEFNSTTIVTRDTCLKASVLARTYIVKIITGYTETEYIQYEVTYNSYISEPIKPVIDGLIFNGWKDSEGNDFYFNTPIVKNTIIKANFQKSYLSVTFVYYEGSNTTVSTKTISVLYGEKINKSDAPTDTKDGEVFDYWIDNDNKKFSFDIPITKNITLTAKYKTTNTVTFKYYGKSGKWVEKTFIVVYGKTITSVQYKEVTSDYSTPEDKQTSSNGQWDADPFTTIYANTTITAQYETKVLTVTFVYKKGTSDTEVTSAKKVNYGTEITSSDIPSDSNSRTGYNLDGWTNENNLQTYTFDNTTKFEITQDTTFTAEYSKKAYTITFYDEYGKIIENNTKTVEYGGKLSTVPGYTVKQTGYKFDGWFFGHQQLTMSTTVVSNIDAYATISLKEFTVSFYSGTTINTSNYAYVSSTTVKYGLTPTLPTTEPIKNGYVFEGWDIANEKITGNTSGYSIFYNEALVYTTNNINSTGGDIIDVGKKYTWGSANTDFYTDYSKDGIDTTQANIYIWTGSEFKKLDDIHLKFNISTGDVAKMIYDDNSIEKSYSCTTKMADNSNQYVLMEIGSSNDKNYLYVLIDRYPITQGNPALVKVYTDAIGFVGSNKVTNIVINSTEKTTSDFDNFCNILLFRHDYFGETTDEIGGIPQLISPSYTINSIYADGLGTQSPTNLVFKASERMINLGFTGSICINSKNIASLLDYFKTNPPKNKTITLATT